MSMGMIAEARVSSPPAAFDYHGLERTFPAAAGAASAPIIRRDSLLPSSERACLLSAAATKSFHIVLWPTLFCRGGKTFLKFNEGNFDTPRYCWGKSRAAGPSRAGDDDFLSATPFKAASPTTTRGAACRSLTFIN